jgi:hypothetical protein
MRTAKLTDPVETGKSARDDEELAALGIDKAGAAAGDGEGLAFKPIPPERARITRPFDGYPLKKFKFGEVETFTAFIVALNPTVPVPQDPANKKVRTKKGMVQVNTYHSRVIRDRETKENEQVRFDREITIGGSKFLCAIVPSHNVRAQICFKHDPQKNRVEVDRRYMLLDSEQAGRLKKVFDQVINPKLNMERDAKFIAGESTEDGGEAEPVQE